MENGNKMSQEKLNIKFFTDMKEFYNLTFMPNGTCQFSPLTYNIVHIDLAIDYIFKQYQSFQSYKEFKQDFLETINAAVNMYQFQIDMSNIMPLVKPRTFQCKDINFIRDVVKNTELDILYVQDTKSLFKFISQYDIRKDEIDIELLKQRAWQNLSNIFVPLKRLDDRFEVYCVSNFDNAATLIFTEHMQRQIERKLRTKDWIFCIPSISNLILAKYSQYNIDLLDYIKEKDTDYNKISTEIYRIKNGVISTLKKGKPALTLI